MRTKLFDEQKRYNFKSIREIKNMRYNIGNVHPKPDKNLQNILKHMIDAGLEEKYIEEFKNIM
jgi:hypothetical protein